MNVPRPSAVAAGPAHQASRRSVLPSEEVAVVGETLDVAITIKCQSDGSEFVMSPNLLSRAGC